MQLKKLIPDKIIEDKPGNFDESHTLNFNSLKFSTSAYYMSECK